MLAHSRWTRLISLVVLVTLIVSLLPPPTVSAASTQEHVTTQQEQPVVEELFGPPTPDTQTNRPLLDISVWWQDATTVFGRWTDTSRSESVVDSASVVSVQAEPDGAASLQITVTPTTVFAGEERITVTVTALDSSGARATDYSGRVRFSSTSDFDGLPSSHLFRESDAGQKTWTEVGFQEHGQHALTVSDGTLEATSALVTVKEVVLTIDVSPTTVFANEETTVTVSARDTSGALVPGYRGRVSFRSTSKLDGLLSRTFREADAGQYTWTEAMFREHGQHTLTASDGYREATSALITVKEVFLTLNVTPNTVFAGAAVIDVTVTVRDTDGNLVPEYRGWVTFDGTASFYGLGSRKFRDSDAGQYSWDEIFVSVPGEHTLTATDGTRSITSEPITIEDVVFDVTFSPSAAYINDPALTLIVRVLNGDGELVPEFEGSLNLNSSVPMSGLPQGPIAGVPDFTFRSSDGGQKAFTELAFTENGEHTVTVSDFRYTERQTTSNAVSVTEPSEPTPAPGREMPPSFVINTGLMGIAPPPIEYGWGQPYRAVNDYMDSNDWRGYPDYAVPAAPGNFYIVSGAGQIGPNEWWAGSFYACVYQGWENPLTAERVSEGGLGFQDPTFIDVGLRGCTEWSADIEGDGANIGFFGPKLTHPAPLETQGTHMTINTGGNTAGSFYFTAGPLDDARECDGSGEGKSIADPIDARTGTFNLAERDLGIETGCTDVGLYFERAYSTLATQESALSPGWVHNYEQQLVDSEDGRVIVQRPRGSYLVFQDVGGDVYASPDGNRHLLTRREGGGWALIYRDRRADLFDAEGRLEAQQDSNGNRIWMTHETYTRGDVTGSRLARVDAPGGRYLWFGYDFYNPTRLILVGDHTGRKVRFGYDSYGRLETVTNPLGDTATYVYPYPTGEEDDDTAQWLTWFISEKIDEAGNTVFSNTYNDDGQVIAQINNTGLDLTMSYDVLTDTAQIVDLIGSTEAETVSALYLTTAEDQMGTQNQYFYGSDGLMRLMIDPNGGRTLYRGYTSTRKATEMIDAEGNVTRITYNDLGLPTTIVDAENNTTTMTYDDWGNVETVTDARDQVTTFEYDGPNVTRVIDATGREVEMTYAEQSGWLEMLTAVTHPEQGTTTMSYNEAGDLVAITDALDQTTRIAYDALGRPEAVTDARDHTTTFTYDDADRLVEMTNPLSETTSMTYDATGNLVRVVDPAGASTVMTYTESMLLTAIEDPLEGVVTIEYDGVGRPRVITDQLGNTTTTTYDQAGRPVAVTDPLDNTTRYAYDLLGNTTVLTDANGHATTMTYDRLSRLTSLVNAEGQALRYRYDAVGNVVAISDTLDAATTLTYDDLNRPLMVTDADGHTTTYTYNARGLLDSIKDGNDQVTQYAYTPLGQIKEVIANLQPGVAPGNDVNVSTQFVYDAVGNLTRLTDPRSYETTFTYDAANRVESSTDPLDRTSSYTYDARGLVERLTKPDGTEIEYAYDERGLLTGLTAPDQTVTYDYDALGRRTEMVDTTGTTTYEYDDASRPLTITLSMGDAVGYRYDAVGNRTRLIYPDGQVARLDYNAANQMATVTDWNSQQTSYTYDAVGRMERALLPNGVRTVYNYSAAGLIDSITHATDTGLIGSYTYTYDDTGRRLTATEDGRTLTYDYDGLYRLQGVDGSDGSEYRYTYDAAGNRLTAEEPSGTTNATYDVANQLLTLNGVPVQYDANGNLIDDGTQQYVYDDLDRLVSVTQGITTTTFGYTGDGDRLWQEVADARTTFALDLNTALPQVLAQQSPDQSTRYLPGIGQQVGAVWQYLHTDALGSYPPYHGSGWQRVRLVALQPVWSDRIYKWRWLTLWLHR
ncbi:MAG: hypothetical protein GFH27_549305n218 [Chloroflexi bacterium AL-W]|nr:hypothetical protein [Chloroflexi bacterium AL-W]